MSEISNTIEQRANILAEFMIRLINGENGAQLVKDLDILNIKFIPKDILPAFDLVMEQVNYIQKVKVVSNKLFNLLYQILKSYPALEPRENSLLYFIRKDNEKIDAFLQDIRPILKDYTKNRKDETRQILLEKFRTLQNLNKHYSLLQNIIFPIAEKHWPNHKCLQLLWYIQDIVVDKLKKLVKILSATEPDFDTMFKISAEVFFDAYTLIFRENHVLIPVLLETVDTTKIDANFEQASEIGLTFVTLPEISTTSTKQTDITDKTIDLGTGYLTPEQIALIFRHLPLDITYVDENDEVKFFSDSPDRAFPRTRAIIGRKVQNCHPPDSVHIVNKIVDEFRKGTRNKASFWIHFKDKYLLIQYFAVRDKQGNYRGVLEVTQDIADIQKISGEKRLLDWE